MPNSLEADEVQLSVLVIFSLVAPVGGVLADPNAWLTSALALAPFLWVCRGYMLIYMTSSAPASPWNPLPALLAAGLPLAIMTESDAGMTVALSYSAACLVAVVSHTIFAAGLSDLTTRRALAVKLWIVRVMSESLAWVGMVFCVIFAIRFW